MSGRSRRPASGFYFGCELTYIGGPRPVPDVRAALTHLMDDLVWFWLWSPEVVLGAGGLCYNVYGLCVGFRGIVFSFWVSFWTLKVLFSVTGFQP